MKKKVLLVNPKFTEEVTIFSIPISLLYLGSWLVYKGYEVSILDALHFKDASTFNERIKLELLDALCVGISVMSSQIPSAIQISKFVRQCDGSVPIVWGGVHPTLYPEQTAKPEFVDYVVKGEGENTLTELLDEIKQGTIDSCHIKGLAFRNRVNGVVSTPDREPMDVNELPAVEWSLIENLKPDSSLKEISELTLYGLPLLTSRGCPHRCSFCVPKGTEVLMRDMRWVYIQDVKIGDKIIGVQQSNGKWKYAAGEVTNTFQRRDMVYAIKTEGGTVYSTKEHPWLMHNRWRSIQDVENGSKYNASFNSERASLRKLSSPTGIFEETIDFKKGYISGVIVGDGCFRIVHHTRPYGEYDYKWLSIVGDYEMLERVLEYGKDLGIPLRRGKFSSKLYRCNWGVYLTRHKVNEMIERMVWGMVEETPEYMRGFLSGFYDAEGSYDGKVIRLANKIDNGIRKRVGNYITYFGFKYVLEKSGIRLLGNQAQKVAFLTTIQPCVVHKREGIIGRQVHQSCRIEEITPIGEQEVYNLSTTIENYIASGFITHNCVNSIMKTKYRFRQTDLVLNDIERLLALGVKRIHFEDEDFFASKVRIRELVNGIRDNGLDFKWVASVRTDYFRANYLGSEEFLTEVKESGCYLMGAGAESGSQRILDMIKKDTTVEDTLNMARCLDRVGINANFAFMIGLPNEEESDYRKTLKLIEEVMKINYSFSIVGPQIYRPYPGSQLYLECLEYGLKQPDTIEEWADSPYIHLELSRRSYYDKNLYPWIRYKGDLTDLVFYAVLMGFKPERELVTRLLRFIGRMRCQRYYFKYPIAKKVYGLLRGTRLEKVLRRN